MEFLVLDSNKNVVACIRNDEVTLLREGYEVKYRETYDKPKVSMVEQDLPRFEKVSPNTFFQSFTINHDEKIDVYGDYGFYPEVLEKDDAISRLQASAFKALELVPFPKRATKGSAGYDFYSPFSFTLEPNESIIVQTGMKCYMPQGVVLELYPRSSLGYNYGIMLANTVGIIDSDYYNNPSNEGHISIKLTNFGKEKVVIEKYNRIAQGIFKSYLITSNDHTVSEREGGTGSTGK